MPRQPENGTSHAPGTSSALLSAREHLLSARAELLRQVAQIDQALKHLPGSEGAPVSTTVLSRRFVNRRPNKSAEMILRERGDWMTREDLKRELISGGAFEGNSDPNRAFDIMLTLATKGTRFLLDEEGRVGLREWQLAEKAGV